MRNSVRTDFESAPFDIIDGDRGKNYPKQNEFSADGHCLFLSAANVTKSGFDFLIVSSSQSKKTRFCGRENFAVVMSF